ncbi:hypothetical protein FB45DRAFT_866066 [Roridomyces roridus]|uniref:Uncharacterized protein n=1 Tax=Roridomyces roridus TaxID=1738132 RepID=A0AAD7FQK1_9AGAR|nr:hypothetical protein FB45DRAFT_866066 [Roridomyces roridus]
MPPLVVHHDSPFAESDEPPPPVVVLLLHTDLEEPTSTSLLIHEDLTHAETMPSAIHTYPPTPTIIAAGIPRPLEMTKKSIEKHTGWDKKKASQIKVLFQDRAMVQEIYRRAAVQFPELALYNEHWATECILQAHLKNKTLGAKRALDKDVVATVEELGQRKLRSRIEPATEEIILGPAGVTPSAVDKNGSRLG